MSSRAGFVWSSPQHFTRYIEDTGVICELITPHMLAAPFFRTTLNCLIIPTGFGNPEYSNILPALRASSTRIRRFVENGGNLLVFGAAINRQDAYDWLPFSVRYTHAYNPRPVSCSASSISGSIIEDYDISCIECDGCFSSYDADCVGVSGTDAVILEKMLGKGTIVITSVHEFPSRRFLASFCNSGIPVLF